MRRLLLGSLLCSALASCRTDKPPVISIVCIGDGFGGADCVDSTGAKIYRKPSELLNYWMTTQVDESNFAAWCYQVNPPTAEKQLEAIYAKTR